MGLWTFTDEDDDFGGSVNDDLSYGYGGNDKLGGKGGDDTLYGGEGNDELYGDEGNDTLYGEAGNDTLFGGIGNDILDGGAGNDRLDGGTGMNNLKGGAGDDSYIVRSLEDKVVELAGGGNDSVLSYIDGYVLATQVETLFLKGWSATTATGNAGNNILWGNDSTDDNGVPFVDGEGQPIVLNNSLSGGAGNDILYGQAGDDMLFGDAGNDVLDGQSGVDVLSGGAGNDIYYVDSQGEGQLELYGGVNWWGSQGDIVCEYSWVYDSTQGWWTRKDQGGIDTIVSSASYELEDWGGFVENLILAANAGNIDGTGNGLSNIILGNEADNILDGGWGGNDILKGGDGNDTLIGGWGGINTLYGENGNDLLGEIQDYSSSKQTDKMFGGDGDDTYLVDAKGDTVIELADQGHDTVVSSIDYTLGLHVEDLVLERQASVGKGNGLANEIWANDEDYQDSTLFGYGGEDILHGGSGWDYLDGGSGADQMHGGDGGDIYVVDDLNDQVFETGEGGGWDEVRSFTSIDELFANVEDLALQGTAMNATGNTLDNFIRGNSLANILDGGAGSDRLFGGGGNDTLYGGEDDVYDSLFGEAGNDTLHGGNGGAYLDGGIGNDIMHGGSGWNNVYGGAGNDKLIGGDGGNTLDGGTGYDEMIGGAGHDQYYVDSLLDKVVEGYHEDGEGNPVNSHDIVNSSVTFTLPDYVENLYLTGIAGIGGTGNDDGNEIVGNSGANALKGLGGDDELTGGAGTDTLYGGDGNDYLNGGSGNDKMYGGLGSDLYEVDSTGDMVVEENEQDQDTIFHAAGDWIISSVSYSLPQYVENMVLIGSANINATGNALANVIYGNNSDNVLNGKEGDDTLIGGAGDDAYWIDTAGDSVDERLLVFQDGPPELFDGIDAGGNDTVVTSLFGYDLAAYTIDGNFVLENLTFVGSLVEQSIGYGNGLDNVMTGNGWSDLHGGAGDDTYVLKALYDTASSQWRWDAAVEDAGNGEDTVKTTMSGYMLADNCENLILLGTAVRGDGNAGDNQIFGNKANNILYGDSGNDLLNGNMGADIMFGGSDSDTYWMDNIGDKAIETETIAEGGGHDQVWSSVSFTLGSFVEDLHLTGTAAINGTGNAENNYLVGNTKNNILSGNAGDDRLEGRAGNDTLAGGSGSDTFVFNTALNATNNLDKITDFAASSGDPSEIDFIELDQSIFGSLTDDVGGFLDDGHFKSALGTAADPLIGDGDDYILYNQTTGALYYAADGIGGVGTAQQFALLTNKADLTADNFSVVVG